MLSNLETMLLRGEVRVRRGSNEMSKYNNRNRPYHTGWEGLEVLCRAALFDDLQQRLFCHQGRHSYKKVSYILKGL